ncbi:XdhC family protein [Phormidium tenue FACHB-886]|nr:XdhC family protein [Phormidium tenue FACHB-886]
MSLDYYRQLAKILPQTAVVVATVIKVKGSVPREVGAKMLIYRDDRTEICTWGTIGGGAGEAKVIRQAKAVLETGEKQTVEIDLSGATHRETQGICGGLMQVLLGRWSGVAAIELVKQILNRLEAGQAATLITPWTGQSPYLLSPASSDSPHDATRAFSETLQPPPTLLIVGAGHVGIQLAKVAALVGFRVAIQDDRPAWANAQHYPQADLIFNQPIELAVEQLSAHAQLYAALVTRGYQYDLQALTALQQRPLPCRYIGMIGSEKRVRQVRQAIEQAGRPIAQPLFAPIGLNIGALTPEEIAVSITAELILVRRGGTGQPLSA